MALTKANKDYIARNVDKDIKELLKDLGLKNVTKEIKTYLATLQEVTPKEKKGHKVKNGAFALAPTSKTEEDNFHKVLPPASDSIVHHEVKWPNR